MDRANAAGDRLGNGDPHPGSPLDRRRPRLRGPRSSGRRRGGALAKARVGGQELSLGLRRSEQVRELTDGHHGIARSLPVAANAFAAVVEEYARLHEQGLFVGCLDDAESNWIIVDSVDPERLLDRRIQRLAQPTVVAPLSASRRRLSGVGRSPT